MRSVTFTEATAYGGWIKNSEENNGEANYSEYVTGRCVVRQRMSFAGEQRILFGGNRRSIDPDVCSKHDSHCE